MRPIPAGSSLPSERTLLVGRAEERAALLALPGRLLSLVGPPGVGKSRLALSAVREEGGPAAWVDLSEVRTAQALSAAVSAVLGLDVRAEPGRALAGRGDLRLVLDGAQHLDVEARALLGSWLDEAPALRLLLTSISRLDIEGEQVVELHPLPLAEAVALFEARAGALGWRPGPVEDPREIEALVEQLDRLPLAIELAASRSSVLTPRQLRQRLAAGMALDGGPYGSLRAAVAFAWDLLSPGEQRVLAWCSVFRGGFDLEAAEAVIDAPDLLSMLDGLRAHSMLQREDSRFSLLESVRSLAAEQLDACGERPQAEARHATWFHAAGEARARLTRTREEASALRWFRIERENLLAAFERSRDPEEAARIALVLHLALVLQGPLERAAALLDRSLSQVRAPRLRARLLHSRADVYWRQGQPLPARTGLDEALRLLRQGPVDADGQRLLGRILTLSGRLWGAMGERGAARRELHEAISIFEAAKEPFFEGVARNGLGTVEDMAGDPVAAEAAFSQALSLFQSCSHPRHQGVASTNLAVMSAAAGRLAAAEDLLLQARDLYRQSGSRSEEVAICVNLGHVYLGTGQLDAAEAALRDGLSIEREVGKRDFEGLAIGNLALVSACRGELRAARQQLQQALSLLEETGNRQAHAAFLPFRAALEAAAGQVEEARQSFALARETLEARGDREHLQALFVLEGFLDLAGPGVPEERQQAARSRVEARPAGGADLAVARALLLRALDGFSGGATPTPPPSPEDDALVVAPEMVGFSWKGQAVDLSRRGPLRRVLHALVEQRLIAPGLGLPVERLFELGWPGERALPLAASNRVYAAIRALRALGLEGVLLRRDDGYLLDPEVPVRRSQS